MRIPAFRIADDVRSLGVHGAYCVLTGLDNRIDPAGLGTYRSALTARLGDELHEGFITASPVLAGFRALQDAVGRSNRRFVASAEALVGLSLRSRVVPTIDPLVDLYNGVSLETRLSLGAHDLAALEGDIMLRITEGAEHFTPLGGLAPEPIPAGEYGYVDGPRDVICRLEVRQCERTKVTLVTTDCFYILQGNAATPASMLEAALERLVGVSVDHCGGRLAEAWIVADA